MYLDVLVSKLVLSWDFFTSASPGAMVVFLVLPGHLERLAYMWTLQVGWPVLPVAWAHMLEQSCVSFMFGKGGHQVRSAQLFQVTLPNVVAWAGVRLHCGPAHTACLKDPVGPIPLLAF